MSYFMSHFWGLHLYKEELKQALAEKDSALAEQANTLAEQAEEIEHLKKLYEESHVK